jgi:SM-20-related protein
MDGSGVTFELAIDRAALPALRDQLAASGRIRVTPALALEAAEALQRELSESSAWVRTMRQGKIERELDSAALAQLSTAQLAAIEQFARQGDASAFRFLHDAIRISTDPAERRARGWAIDRLAGALNSPAMLELVSALAGEEVTDFRGDATRYLPGHFLTTHNDGRKRAKRVLAFVLNLSHWHIDWGGLLLFHDANGDAECGWTPRFNSVNLFAVPQFHSVSWVSPLAPVPRFTVSGWFYAS